MRSLVHFLLARGPQTVTGPRMRPVNTLLALLFLFGLPSGCRQNIGGPNKDAPLVRVRLLQNADIVRVTAGESPVLESVGGDRKRINLPANSSIDLQLSANEWRAGNTTLGVGEIILQPASEGSVAVNGTYYRGRYRLVPVGGGRFDLVNDVDLESYLKGVVSKELLRNWHPEAYKAQAITARTYALYEVKSSGFGRHWDLANDERSQVYGGINGESDKSRDAVDATSGVVLAFGEAENERIFKAYFSSCCGGVTQSAYDAFGDDYIPPLGELRVGSLCNASSRFNWNVAIKKDELTRRIRAWGARKNRPEKDMALLDRIDVAAVNQFKRPVRFYFTDIRGQRYSLGGEECRWACNADAPKGAPILSSSYFTPISEQGQIRFVEGHGWGHGVGLCQWCTEARAENGMSSEDILVLAFPKSHLVRAY